ncbi:MAG: hypothetical protein II315_03750 [Rikenellaceae bacterium]|nr:hypothetical protein [Rikenellaceae bacterium]
MMNCKRLFSMAMAAILLVGCMARIDSVVTSVDPKGWYSGQPKGLIYTNEDTTALNTLSIIVRYDNRLIDSHLRMSVSVITPDSLTMTEEIKIAIPVRRDDSNRATIAIEPFRRHAQLSRVGDYRFELEPSQSIIGITGIGIEIKNEGKTASEMEAKAFYDENIESSTDEAKQAEETDN